MYIDKSLIKFYKNGDARLYRGNTIISFMNDPEQILYKIAKDFKKELQNLNISNKLALLPETSYHMTIFTLLRDIDRNTEIWPKYIKEDENFSDIDIELLEKFKKIEPYHDVYVKLTDVRQTGLVLEGFSKEDDMKLRDYRERLHDAFKIKHEGHEDYIFHISTSYQMLEFDDKDNDEFKSLRKDFLNKHLEQASRVKIQKPEFVIFNDMLAYYKNLSKRI